MSTSGERVCKQEAEEAAGLQRQSRSAVTAASTQHFSFLASRLLNCSAGEKHCSRRSDQETSGPCWSGLCSDPVWEEGGGCGTSLSCSQTTRAPEWNLLENLKNRSTPHRTLVILADSSFEKTHLSGGGRRSPVLLMRDTSGNVFEDFPDSWREISFKFCGEKTELQWKASCCCLFQPAQIEISHCAVCAQVSPLPQVEIVIRVSTITVEWVPCPVRDLLGCSGQLASLTKPRASFRE